MYKEKRINMKQDGYLIVSEAVYNTPEDFEKAEEEVQKINRATWHHPINTAKGHFRYFKNHNIITGKRRKKT